MALNAVSSQFQHHAPRELKTEGKEYEVPISELPNYLTSAIDIGTASDIVKSLRQCDSQIFSGWRNFPSIYDEETIVVMDKISAKVAEMLQNASECAVVLSGCGTSGRLAFFMVKKFSQLAKTQQLPSCYEYLIAGEDLALFTSQEAPEDDWKRGQEDLKEIARGKKQVLYIGVTCGLSAPYVAGQLDYCMRHPDVFTPVLLGFNPVNQARRNIIEGWNKSFFDVANTLKGHANGIILNPVVGPEAITGSSRMKGGSATKIILECILLKAHCQLARPKSTSSFNLPEVLMTYESVYRKTYLEGSDISRAVELAGESLRCNGHVYYIGWGLLALMGLLDASECVPTFSANFNDIRGFVSEGYTTLNNREGELLIDGSNKLNISLEDFQTLFLPELSSHDTVVFILPDKNKSHDVVGISKMISQRGAHVVGLMCEQQVDESFKDTFQCLVHVKLPSWCDAVIKELTSPSSATLLGDCLQQCHKEIAIKWILNAVSTGAHVLKGKILRSYMIDVKVSNNKLFHRAVSIVSKFARVDEEKAVHSVLQAVYRADFTENVANRTVSENVKRGSVMEQIVPVAVLVATEKFDVESALEILKETTVAHVLEDIGLLKD